MHNNGVTHSTVCDDFEGVFTVLHWLSYMPKVSPPRLLPAPKGPENPAFSPQLTASACGTPLWEKDFFLTEYSLEAVDFFFFFLKAIFCLLPFFKNTFGFQGSGPLLMISSQGSLESFLGSDPSFLRLRSHCGAFPFVIGVHPSRGLPREPGRTEVKSPIAPLSTRLPRETCELYLFLRAWLSIGVPSS